MGGLWGGGDCGGDGPVACWVEDEKEQELGPRTKALPPPCPPVMWPGERFAGVPGPPKGLLREKDARTFQGEQDFAGQRRGPRDLEGRGGHGDQTRPPTSAGASVTSVRVFPFSPHKPGKPEGQPGARRCPHGGAGGAVLPAQSPDGGLQGQPSCCTSKWDPISHRGSWPRHSQDSQLDREHGAGVQAAQSTLCLWTACGQLLSAARPWRGLLGLPVTCAGHSWGPLCTLAAHPMGHQPHPTGAAPPWDRPHGAAPHGGRRPVQGWGAYPACLSLSTLPPSHGEPCCPTGPRMSSPTTLALDPSASRLRPRLPEVALTGSAPCSTQPVGRPRVSHREDREGGPDA